ncbi:MAG: hypothetical protein HC770_10570 [Pseudanabaena sp. CRU_2_10]|nr:hypothetical protein [Pseudanabaena sp. CRU_2_10]
MQRLLLSGLSVLLLSAIATPSVHAQVIGANPSSQVSAMPRAELKPFNLVFLVLSRLLEKKGIPSAGQFIQDARVGKVTAKSLVQAAVDEKRLPAQTLEDDGYLSAVESQLMSLYTQH